MVYGKVVSKAGGKIEEESCVRMGVKFPLEKSSCYLGAGNVPEVSVRVYH